MGADDWIPIFARSASVLANLRKTSSLEACFTKLADTATGGSEIHHRPLLVKIDGLQRQLDDLTKIANQSGAQGPPGPPGRLLIVKTFQAGNVYYQGDVVSADTVIHQALQASAAAPLCLLTQNGCRVEWHRLWQT